MNICDYCQHVEMCGWRKELEEEGCEFFDDGNKWIPISERLPDEPNVYTVTDSKGDVVRFVFDDTASSREYWLRCAKAWMPLPKPYRDLISRGEKMNRQRKVVITVTYNDLGTIVDTKAEELDLSAQPERKTGKWEQESESLWKDRRHRWKCSACGKHVLIGVYDDPIKAGLMFCPNCGAEMLKMEGGNG